MDWAAWIGISAASLSVLGAIVALYRRVSKAWTALQERLASVEASLRTSARARLTRECIILHAGALVRVPEGTIVLVREWSGGMVSVLVQPWRIETQIPADALEPDVML